MITNTSITIYNKYIDSHEERWQRAIVNDVNWQGIKAVSGLQKLLSDNSAMIYVPLSSASGYVEPKDWKEDRSSGWTFQEGDVIVKGSVTDEITESFSITDLKGKYSDVVSINSIDFMDLGSLPMQHYEIGCK